MKLTANENVRSAARQSRRMRVSRFAFAALLAAGLFVPSLAVAQEEPAAAPADESGFEDSGEEAANEPTETVAMTQSPEVAAPPAASGGSFADKIDYMLMASGYYLFGSGMVPGDSTGNIGYNGIGYPYTQFPGFGLNFIGGDVTYSDGDFGGTLNLRWGNGAGLLTPLAPVKQAYVTWTPGNWAFDVGFFDTIYGAEVADEWANVNFSRGALYFNRQPFNHLGLRVGGEVSDGIGLNFLVVNGDVGVATGLPAGQVETQNILPSFGAQVNISSIENLGIVVGYLVGANGVEFDNNSDLGHFFDVVITYTTGALSLVANADVTIDPEVVPDETAMLFGGMVGGSYALSDAASVGARYEFLSGNDAGKAAGGTFDLQTITATFRYKPNDYLTFSVEPRVELADADVYFTDDAPEDTWFGMIFGVSGVISE